MNSPTVQEDFLPLDLITEIKQFSRDNNVSNLNITRWEQSIVLTSAPVLVYNLNELIREKVKKVLIDKLDFLPSEFTLSSSYFLWTRYSYIPWHSDYVYDLGLTVYLNETWDTNWAGMLVYELNGEYKAIYPKFNNAVYFSPPLQHCTVMANIQAPIRETLQVFIKYGQ